MIDLTAVSTWVSMYTPLTFGLLYVVGALVALFIAWRWAVSTWR